MPPTSTVLLLLLVLVIIGIAHGQHNGNRNLSKRILTGVTSLNYTIRDVERVFYQLPSNHLNLDDTVSIRESSSVVQDWSLVCKQLCGADLGGAPCTSYCEGINLPKELQRYNAGMILKTNRTSICQDLCRLQLGGNSCNCPKNIDPEIQLTASGGNIVCSSFCNHSYATLAGCSLCRGPAKNGARDEKPFSGLRQVPSEYLVEGRASDSTTPDWDEVCVSLCKTGDGGSLCNCDLSPFKKSSN